MKKIGIILLVGVLMFQLAGCGAQPLLNIDGIGEDTQTTTTTTTATTTTTTQYVAPQIWEKTYYVDDFKQPTDEWYIRTKKRMTGTFSNSATTNSDLEVSVLIDDESIAFMLYCYGWSQEKNFYSKPKYYNFKIRDGKNRESSFSGVMVSEDGDRVFVFEEGEEVLINALLGGGTVLVYLEEMDNTGTNYLFTMESGNFSEVYGAGNKV